MRPSTIAASDGINGNEDTASRDEELVAAARAGSSAAFEELQKLYSHRLYRRILSITKNHEDAEDALQNTFLRAFVAISSFEGRSRFSSWLTTIAINSALMILRKRRTKAEVSLDLPAVSEEHSPSIDVCDTALNPEQIYDQLQRCHCAIRAIHKLNPRLRSTLSIWIEQQSSMKEVARTLDVSLATVKARLHRARKRLSHDAGFTDLVQNSGSLPETKRRDPIRRLQNREQPCLTCK